MSIRKCLWRILPIWISVYPVLTGLLWALEPALVQPTLSLRIPILSAFMVPILVPGALPLVQKLGFSK